MTSASDVMTPQRVSGVISAWNGESGTLKLPKDDVIHTYILILSKYCFCRGFFASHG